MNKLKTAYTVLLVLLVSLTTKAQFISAEVGIDGLTCSACTRSAEMSIRKLPFVQDVKMNIENTNGIITFKADTTIDMGKIAQAIVDAGFSVRYLTAIYKAPGTLDIAEGYCMAIYSFNYQFVKISPEKIKNNIVLKFIGKEFLPPKEFKKWKDILKPECAGTNTVYFVTL
jgi:copper chaperone CopZ